MADVVLEKLVKTYSKGSVRAVDGVSFTVEQGQLFGLIGPDGAGKSTIFRMLTTLLLPDSGSASVMGYDIVRDYRSIRQHIGYMPGRFSLYQDLTVEENLHFFAMVFNTSVQKNYSLIKDIYTQLVPFKDRRAGQLFGGMKQKLALCCALIHRPQVLFLDEPTTGVDAVSRHEFWEMLARLKQEGITILVSTPYMDEATLCERIALIQNGRLLSIDTPQGIMDNYPDPLFAVRAADMGKLLLHLRGSQRVGSCFSFGSHHHITLSDSNPQTGAMLLAELSAQGLADIEMSSVEPSIEDCFIQLMS